MNFRLLFPLFLPLSAVLACSSSNGDGASSGCQRYFQELTAYGQRCAATIAPDRTTIDGFDTVCSNFTTAPGAGKVDALLGACASAIAGADCATNDVTSCEFPTGTGTLADGAPCGQDVQCTGYCKATDSSATSKSICGTCASVIAIGAACSGTGGECGTNARCTDGKCAAIVKLAKGAACRDTAGATLGDCAAGSTCNASGACAAPAKTGEACTTAFDCEGVADCTGNKCAPLPGEGAACTFSCVSGFACGSDKKCAKPVAVALGAACDEVRQCTSSFCEGEGVSNNGDGVTHTPGICTAYIATGAACTSDGKGRCEPFAECLGGTCQVLDPAACK